MNHSFIQEIEHSIKINKYEGAELKFWTVVKDALNSHMSINTHMTFCLDGYSVGQDFYSNAALRDFYCEPFPFVVCVYSAESTSSVLYLVSPEGVGEKQVIHATILSNTGNMWLPCHMLKCNMTSDGIVADGKYSLDVNKPISDTVAASAAFVLHFIKNMNLKRLHIGATSEPPYTELEYVGRRF